MNTATLATVELGLVIDAPAQPLDLHNAVGIALRHNPKRAHLLVSNLLGKHTPQRPEIINVAARILAVRAANALLDDTDNTERLLAELNAALAGNGPIPASPEPAPVSALVVGFAEAATALGATVADHLGAYYLCSTRTPQREAYGHFLEAHSHAADHYLTPADPRPLDDATLPVVLVDDELTTGRTAMNTIRALHTRAAHTRYILATLADLRTSDSRSEMAAFADEIGVRVDVVSLFTASITVPEGARARAESIIAARSTPTTAPTRPLAVAYEQTAFTCHPRNARDGIVHRPTLDPAVSALADTLDPYYGQRLIVLGVEEDMFLALTTARVLAARGHDVDYSSTTRSPAALIADDAYPLRDGVRFPGPDGMDRFVYNITGRYDRAIIVSTDPVYASTLPNLAHALAGHVSDVAVAAPTVLPEPLVGPAFGSYAAEDVKWLLKDLSELALEVSLEDREELVQAGSHYAESLPQEYQPDPAYMALFDEALAANAERVARDVEAVAHRIMTARHGRPVLVSLARAGTPVGVLLRRYLVDRFDYDAPHYAISIVRGRGIDTNALAYIAAHHRPEDVVFVDGWTGKGAITGELTAALADYELDTGIGFPDDLAVLADTGSCVTLYGTRDDYLIPSAALNSTVSGLISRTVLNDTLIGAADYHGAKFYAELASSDVSSRFIDTVASHFAPKRDTVPLPLETPTWAAWAEVERLSEAYGIGSVNLVKPGVGETTRVLLRRVPWKVLVHPNAGETVAHIRALADARGVPVEEVPDLAFNAVGLIHPHFTRSATGADGLRVTGVAA
jgi:pyrimidine operon attenuation protein/uracil phosphoribosyltransferase